MTAKELSSCCGKRAKVNRLTLSGYFCTECGKDCTTAKPKPKSSTLSQVRKPSGEREVFERVWLRCKGKSEVSGADLLPPDHPMWHWQFSHGAPKSSYPQERNNPDNITACTVEEHTEEWPFVKELTDDELRREGMAKWIPQVTAFRALRLKYHQRLRAELSGGVTEQPPSI